MFPFLSFSHLIDQGSAFVKVLGFSLKERSNKSTGRLALRLGLAFFFMVLRVELRASFFISFFLLSPNGLHLNKMERVESVLSQHVISSRR